MTLELDLFGFKGCTDAPKGGYAAMPNSANNGMTCGDCAHYRSLEYHGKRYRKCHLMREAWTHGAGSDIKKSTGACSRYEDSKHAS